MGIGINYITREGPLRYKKIYLYTSGHPNCMNKEGCFNYNHAFIYILARIGMIWKMKDVSAIIIRVIPLWTKDLYER